MDMVNMSHINSTLAYSNSAGPMQEERMQEDEDQMLEEVHEREELESQRLQMKELVFLANTFSGSAATALQRGSQGDWIHLRELLQLMQPIGGALMQFHEVQHYLQRLYQYIDINEGIPVELKIFEVIRCVFPDFKTFGTRQPYPPGKQPSKTVDSSAKEDKKKTSELISNNNNHDEMFQLSWKGIEEKLRPKQLNVSDIQRFLPRVVSEISRQEAVWNDGLGLMLIAVNTNIPVDIESIPDSSVDCIDQQRNQLLMATPENKKSMKPRSGLEVVAFLVKSYSSDVTKIWYLNLKQSKSYNPYDLVVVSKNKVEDEHFVISVFGVLHVRPAGESELIPLGQWYREATVFKTIMKIKFYKMFKVFKAFVLWKTNVSFLKFLKIRAQVKKNHLLEVPSMMSAILKVKSLLSEMQDVSLLPNDTCKCYTLDEFKQVVFVILQNAKKYADKLYNHCQKIASKVECDCLEYVQYSEFQMEQKTSNIKESMTLARQRGNKQLKNLKLAKHVEEKLPCFIRLIEELLHQFMLVFISENMSNFVRGVMGANNIERQGLFIARFSFHSESSLLVLSPSPEEFLNSLKTSFDNIPAVLSEVCHPLKLQRLKPRTDTFQKEGDEVENRLTVEELQVLLNYGAKQANEVFKHDHAKGMLRKANGNGEKDSDYNGKQQSVGLLLEVRLGANKVVQTCMSLMQSLMEAAFAEVSEFAEEHRWLATIHSFVKTWNGDTLEAWKGQSASKIEKQVEQIKGWVSLVESVQISLKTSNGVLFVDGGHVQDVIIPGLEEIFTSMMDMIANHCLLSSEELIAELHEISKILSVDTTTIEEFALFYKTLKQCKESAVMLQNKEEYVKSIFEVIRHCYRQLTTDEEETHEMLNAEWNSFLYALQDANTKMNELLPQMIEDLEKSISNLSDEAMEITKNLTSGKFLFAKEDPKELLPKLKASHSRFIGIKEELVKLVKCKEIIEDIPHDLTALSVMQSKIVARHELWKYCEVTAYTIKDWMQTPFVKFQINKVVEKVSKWREAMNKLKVDIPANDEVLCSWIEKVEDFGIDLPLLQELSSVSLKARHWKWLFAGLGQVYNSSYQYLISDLVGFGLRDSRQLVISICNSAAAEYALESHLKKMVRKWEEEEFKLMKYFETKKADYAKDQAHERHQEPQKSKGKLIGPASSRDMFIITGVHELQFQVEDNLVTLQSMLVSPHLSEMRSQAEAWTGYLHQLKVILDMWISCQQKWLYLKKIFTRLPASNSKMVELRKDFDKVDVKYKEHMAAVLMDPKILSILDKGRGERGYRELQGRNLRQLFVHLIAKQEEIIKSLDAYLDDIRASFPRLFFLSNGEILELFAISRDPKALMPFVRKCFPGIINLKFVLPASVANAVRSQLDATLNAHLLEVVCLYGDYGEELNMPAPISPVKSVENWLSDLELAMKSLLWNKMGRCIEERLLHSPSLQSLLNGLGIFKRKERTVESSKPTTSRIKLSIEESENGYWYMVHPFQCVIAAEEVIWTSNMTKALDQRGFESVADVRKVVDSNVEQYSLALRNSSSPEIEKPLPRKLMLLIQSLLVRALYHRELSKDLDKTDVNETSFEWLQCLKYRIDILRDKRRRVRDRQGHAEIFYGASNAAQFGTLSTSQMQLASPYGYEYQGPSSRLVITPLTERALLNLTTALKLYYTGGLYGPTQSGKTETIMELSKQVGSLLVTFSCQSSLSFAKILHFIAGAVQTGALLCLENVTLLPEGMLSVLGQHLDGIRLALTALRRRKFCQFETRDPTLSKEISEENVVKRKRGITVISLHTLVMNRTEKEAEIGNKDCKSMNVKGRPRRRHSIAEIINIADPREEPQKRKSMTAKNVKSETKLDQSHYERDSYNENKSTNCLGNVLVAGQLIKANPLFGCFFTISSKNLQYEGIPDNMRNSTRVFGTVFPDYAIIIQVWLIGNGFVMHKKLAKKITAFREMLCNQFLCDPVFTLSLSLIKMAIEFANKGATKLRKEQENSSTSSKIIEKIEECCIGQAFYSLMHASIYPNDLPNFTRLLKISFPQIKDSLERNEQEDQLLLNSVKQQIIADSLLDKDVFIGKVMQLHETMVMNRSVILLGESGTGKSACYQTLCRALCQFYSVWTQAVKKRTMKKIADNLTNQVSSFSKIHLSTFFHMAMDSVELFGGFNEATQNWSDGLLAKLLRTAAQLHSVRADIEHGDGKQRDAINYWVVFDGPLYSGLTQSLESLLDDRNELCLVNGERIKPPASLRILFETTCLSDASPSIIARSAIVNFEHGLVDWTCIFTSWKKFAQNKYEISKNGFKIIEAVLEHVSDPLTEFLSTDAEYLMSKNVHVFRRNTVICSSEVNSILQMLGAILEKFISREGSERRSRKGSEAQILETDSFGSFSVASKENSEIRFISNAFALAFVWAIGGKLHERCYSKFDIFTRQLFATCPYSVIFPCAVFDCMLQPVNGDLVRWQDSSIDIPKVISSHQYVVTSEIKKYYAIAELLLSSGNNVLLAGESGVGKSAFVKNLLQQKHKMQRIVFTQGLSSKIFQNLVQNYIEEQENRFRCNPLKQPPQQKGLSSNRNLFFIDDIGMTSAHPNCGYCKPSLEVLRQMISEGGVYDHERRYFQHLPSLQFVATFVPQNECRNGGSNYAISSRLFRRMTVMNIVPLNSESLRTVYTSIYKAWLEEFPAYSLTHIEPFAKAIAHASVDIFIRVKEKFIQSHMNPHFMFSHHDLARISKGVFIYSPKSRPRPRKLEKGLFERADSIVNQSMPNLKITDSSFFPDASLSTSDLKTCIGTIDSSPASVSPLIRTIIRLWCHEVCRCFMDRLIDQTHLDTFSSILHNTAIENFCGNLREQQGDSSADEQIVISKDVIKKSSKYRVKFKDIEASNNSEYSGPLITFKNLLGEEKSLTNITFTKHLFIYGTRGLEGAGDHDKGYIECKDQHLEEALRKALNVINSTGARPYDMVLYKDALHHAARLSRTLALAGGHAVLVSLNGHGRANITELVTKAAGMKMMKVSGTALRNHGEFRSVIKDACFVAGLQGKPVVLFIAEGLGDEGMRDVAALMIEGKCPGLYSTEELAAIGNHLLPGGQVGQRRTENKMVAQDRFLRRIMTNLHIVLCVWHGALGDIAEKFPSVISRAACVDIYREWNANILKEVAEKWLISKGKNEFFFKVRWDMGNRDGLLKAIYLAMAQFHLDARSAWDQDFGNLGLEIFSPLKFIELIELFRTLCNAVSKTREDELARLATATDKVKEGEHFVADVEKRIIELSPVLTLAKDDLKVLERNVKTATKEYQDSKQACIDQQKEIDSLKEPIDILKKEAQEEFGKLTPVYEAALHALKSLDVHDVEEIRSYRAPPQGVKFVADMICLMFDKQPNWEEAKLLFMRDNFFQDLIFYEKDKISDGLYKKLENFNKLHESSPDHLMEISKAASSLSVWIRAIYNYCYVLQTFKPKQDQMKEAEERLNKAKARLGERRVFSHQMKSALENTIEIYKEKMKETKSLEKQAKSLISAKRQAESLLGSMILYTDHWKDRITIVEEKLRTAPGDALLCAATICYLGAFRDEVRDNLMQKWTHYCIKGADSSNGRILIPIDQNFSIIAMLSNDDEQMEWKKQGVPNDLFMLTNALCARTCCLAGTKCWPLLIDPHDKATALVRCIEEGIWYNDSQGYPSLNVQNGKWQGTITDAVVNQKFLKQSSQLDSSPRPNTKGHIESSVLSESFIPTEKERSRMSIFSLNDDREQELFRLSDDRDSRTSGPRPISSFSAITNESVFLNKFYSKTGLKEIPDLPPPSPLLELIEEKLLLVDADDCEIDCKLKAAIAKGLPTLVSHLERGINGVLLNSILEKNVLIADDESFYINHKEKKLTYHPNFRLYLSATVPMHFNKANRFVLPLHKALIVNMEANQEGLQNKLMLRTIQSEKPELESQQRSLELDLFYLSQEEKKIQEAVIQKICEISGKILEETSLPVMMNESKDQLQVTKERLAEGMIFKEDLQLKREGYYQVAIHGAMLYSVISKLTQLKSYYEFPLYFFEEQFKRTLSDVKRRKAESGCINARAAEINTTFSLDVYRRLSVNVFLEHLQLFPILLIADQQMKTGKISAAHHEALLKLCSVDINDKDFDLPSSELTSPNVFAAAGWITDSLKMRILYLDRIPIFNGILKSFEKNSNQWEEYFGVFSNLICSCPLEFQHLSMFEKALLWLAVLPAKRSLVCQNLILNFLGPSFTEFPRHSLLDIAKKSKPWIPLIILFPEENENIKEEDPVLTIEALGKSLHMQVITISLGTLEQLKEAERAITSVDKKARKWIILQNCHLQKAWTRQFLRLVEDITDAEKGIRSSKDENNLFKLWLVFRCEENMKIPISISKIGLLVAWDEKIFVGANADGLLKYETTQIPSNIEQARQSVKFRHDPNLWYASHQLTAQERFASDVINNWQKPEHVSIPLSGSEIFSTLMKILNNQSLQSRKTCDFGLLSSNWCLNSNNHSRILLQRDRTILSEREFGRCFHALLQSYHGSSQSAVAPKNNDVVADALVRLIDIHSSLSKKTTSRISKSIYKFFHRLIKTMRDYCEEAMFVLDNAKKSKRKDINTLLKSACLKREDLLEINEILPSKSLRDWEKEVSAVTNALLSYIRPKSRQPLGFDVNLIPNLKGFFASIAEDFCNESFSDVGELFWEGNILQDSDELLPPLNGVYLKGLHLKNAKWDFDSKLVVIAANEFTDVPILHVTPRTKVKIPLIPRLCIPIITTFAKKEKFIIELNFSTNFSQLQVENPVICFVNLI